MADLSASPSAVSAALSPLLVPDNTRGSDARISIRSRAASDKANGLEPYTYLRHVFTELPKAQSIGEVEALLPTRFDSSRLTRDPFGTS